MVVRFRRFSLRFGWLRIAPLLGRLLFRWTEEQLRLPLLRPLPRTTQRSLREVMWKEEMSPRRLTANRGINLPRRSRRLAVMTHTCSALLRIRRPRTYPLSSSRTPSFYLSEILCLICFVSRKGSSAKSPRSPVPLLKIPSSASSDSESAKGSYSTASASSTHSRSSSYNTQVLNLTQEHNRFGSSGNVFGATAALQDNKADLRASSPVGLPSAMKSNKVAASAKEENSYATYPIPSMIPLWRRMMVVVFSLQVPGRSWQLRQHLFHSAGLEQRDARLRYQCHPEPQ